MLKGNKEFYMIDSQNIIHKYALKNATDTINKSIKNVVNFEMSWNLSGGESFAIGEHTIKQAGCIHTTQGIVYPIDEVEHYRCHPKIIHFIIKNFMMEI